MYYIKINKNFVHQVGNQPRLYYDARSTNHQDSPDRSCIIIAVKILKSRNKDVNRQEILVECHLSL